MYRGLVIALLVFHCFGSGFAVTGGHEEILAQVQTYLGQHQAKKAMKLLNQSISKYPSDLDLRVCRAEVFLVMGQEDQAENELNNVLEMDDGNIKALLFSTKLHVRNNALDQASVAVEKAMALNPPTEFRSDLQGMKGRILLRQEKYKAAEEVLLNATASESSSITTAYDLATALDYNNKQEEALMIIENSIERHGLHLSTLLKAGSICNRIESFDDAISYFDLALTIDGQHPVALASLAEAYLQVGDMEAADRYLGMALGHVNGSGLAFKIKGDYHLRMKEPQLACQAYSQAIESGYAEEYGQEEIFSSMQKSCLLD